jgi:alcohol dehydrogenase
MKAVLYDQFGKMPEIRSVPDPSPPDNGVVIKVEATGLCRSDWHGWMGHDPDIKLPHVPGHELSGVVMETGPAVSNWQAGNRVTLPFVCGCGSCPECQTGNHQVCNIQFQPGFTHWGSFAEYVAIDYADVNLVRLPDDIDYVTAASLGCRFVTSFRAVVDQGRLRAGEWIAVHGCGGVGLSAIMIAHSLGARVAAVDISAEKLMFARELGAELTIDGTYGPSVTSSIINQTGGGAHLSIDAFGSPSTCFNSIACLRKRGRHVQVGLLLGDQKHPQLPMDKVVARELEILGSHGIQAHRYPVLLDMINTGRLDPKQLVTSTIPLDEAPKALSAMNDFKELGVTVIDRF